MFRLILFAPSSYTGTFVRCDKILQHKDNIEIYTPAQKGVIKAITGYATERQHKVKVFKVDWQGWGAMAWYECFKAMVEYADAAIIFTDGESKLAYKLEVLCTAKPVPVRVIRYEKAVKERKRPVKAVCHVGAVAEPVRERSSIAIEIDEAIAADKLNKKQKRKKYAVNLPEWCTERYLQAHKEWFYKKFPAAANDHGYLPTEAPLINDANSMQAFISKFLFWSGHRCTRLNVMGRKINGNYVVSSTRKGTADLSSTIKTHSGIGLSVMWEIKFGNDRPSEYQLVEQKKEIAAGGQYFFIYSIEEFFEYYEFVVNL